MAPAYGADHRMSFKIFRYELMRSGTKGDGRTRDIMGGRRCAVGGAGLLRVEHDVKIDCHSMDDRQRTGGRERSSENQRGVCVVLDGTTSRAGDRASARSACAYLELWRPGCSDAPPRQSSGPEHTGSA